MPIIEFKTGDKDTDVIVWEISEDISLLENTLCFTPIEKQSYSLYTSQRRKLHWLASRHIIKQIYGNQAYIEYTTEGAPQLNNSQDFISISHSGNYATIIKSSKYPVGIDIEKIDKRVVNIRRKFLNKKENNLILPDDIETLSLYWTTKEAIYKIYYQLHLTFDQQILIQEVMPNYINVLVNNQQLIKAYYSKINDYYIVWAKKIVE